MCYKYVKNIYVNHIDMIKSWGIVFDTLRVISLCCSVSALYAINKRHYEAMEDIKCRMASLDED